MKDETGSLHLKVIICNTHRCNPPSKVKENFIDVETVIQVLKRQNADVVFLQEFDVYTARSGKGLNEAEAIAKVLDMYWSFGKAIDLQGGAYGVAILSKFPLQKKETVLLPKSPEKNIEQRVLLTVTATLSGLGIGVNGHIGFNEPGSSIVTKTRLTTLTNSIRLANSYELTNISAVPRLPITIFNT